jgi:hypothetical protein
MKEKQQACEPRDYPLVEGLVMATFSVCVAALLGFLIAL